jgi:DNA topoisomerase-3
MPIRLYIAEKPNVAKAIAEELAGGAAPRRNNAGLYEVGGNLVTSCVGHILEQCDPDAYDARYKVWEIEDLPIHPEKWLMQPARRHVDTVKTIKTALRNVDIVVNASDVDSEGQLIVDEVLHYLEWSGPVERILITDLNPGPVKKAVADVRDNKDYDHLYRRALTRSRADWLLGMNCSRLYSKLADKVGIRGVLSVGRVQSAVLGLVAQRDIDIKNFKPHDYYLVKMTVSHGKGDFQASWAPKEDQVGLDAEGRLIEPAVIENLKSLANGPVVIVKAETARKGQGAPLAYSLSDLQKDANNKLDMSLKATLDLAQKLYEEHKLLTYPRTDCSHLPQEQHSMAPEILATIGKNLQGLRDDVDGADPALKSKAFNDSKVSAHHAIVPTNKADPDTIARLSPDERALYEMVCRRYVAQFYPSAEYDATEILIGAPDGESERFIARGKIWMKEGWRQVLGKPSNSDDEASDDKAASEGDGQTLPPVKTGDAARALAVTHDQKKTKPTKPFTDATLLAAMTNIHRHVTNPDTRKLLRENDGIGTEATRASIVDKLIEQHKQLKRVKKTIRTTDKGMMHFRLMPTDLSTPDMAGIFESILKQVEAGHKTMDEFLGIMNSFIATQLTPEAQQAWLKQARKIAPEARPSEFKCRHCNEPLYERTASFKGKRLVYFMCQHTDCGCQFRSDNGKPNTCFKGPLKESDDEQMKAKLDEVLSKAPKCQECGNPLRRFKKKGSDWYFWRCYDYLDKVNCDSVFRDDDQRPGEAFVIRGKQVERVADGPECPECQALTFASITKKDKKPIMTCKACETVRWREEDGMPGAVFLRKGELLKPPADGPQCPQCNESATRLASSTKAGKKTLLWVCEGCDSMGTREKDGKFNKPFKVKGEMRKFGKKKPAKA